ncbi:MULTISPECIES: primosomal replication protein N [Salinivibrio]|jgi:primosomal replication protein N|uniref:Replication restart protein PriB n=2 Tax=Salinivibrio TaxID=51366 RepID=A0ABY7LBB8_9GAMM|nr:MULTISPECIES: primosomal replication protein N [Salinivibrio]ODP98946.1 primosomal replication protein N [Salinivibrio sp. DV]OOF10747.1 primosomal replication protein N [Salinivibrio sp. PR5]OOF20225.1 primosomal replication protein N [Salinivibrio sp. IB574]OOF22589.1 primosomal replication protein N [Salinivibrio sp. IB872]PCE68223.1 primosomal replication protein N [Salinivibrio sp. YCSC6]
MTNRLELAGVISKAPVHRQSPAGIPHCHFVLEHRSTQLEANLPRQVYCRLPVVVSGQGSTQQTHDLALGSHIKVSGFLAYQTSRQGEGKLVLHADHIIDI